jgi:hypothetical protein
VGDKVYVPPRTAESPCDDPRVTSKPLKLVVLAGLVALALENRQGLVLWVRCP